MACSDNVVRAGLTPKLKDVETLLAMLNYVGSSGESKIFQPRVVDEHTLLFAPSVDDFAVAMIQVNFIDSGMYCDQKDMLNTLRRRV